MPAYRFNLRQRHLPAYPQQSVQAVAAFIKQHKLNGVFAFGSSDTISGGTFTYQLMKAIARAAASLSVA
jgi:hypothetical protein